MLNSCTIQGRLVRDPELRTTKSGTAVTSFTIANDNDFGEKKTSFINCTAWRQTAEFVQKYFSKGQMAIVTGRLESREWQDKNGNKQTAWEIQVSQVYFGEAKRQENKFEELEDDGELPFDMR